MKNPFKKLNLSRFKPTFVEGSFAHKVVTIAANLHHAWFMIPPFRFAANSYNKQWNEFINNVIENPATEFSDVDEYSVRVKDSRGVTACIWISNYPYATMNAYRSFDKPVDIPPNRFRPSFYNQIRLRKKITDIQLKNV